MSLGGEGAHCGQGGTTKRNGKTCLSLGCKGQGGRWQVGREVGSTEGLGEGLGGRPLGGGIGWQASGQPPIPILSEPCLDTSDVSWSVPSSTFPPALPVCHQGPDHGGLEVISITDNTPIPHRVCRPRKARAVRARKPAPDVVLPPAGPSWKAHCPASPRQGSLRPWGSKGDLLHLLTRRPLLASDGRCG